MGTISMTPMCVTHTECTPALHRSKTLLLDLRDGFDGTGASAHGVVNGSVERPKDIAAAASTGEVSLRVSTDVPTQTQGKFAGRVRCSLLAGPPV